MLLTADARVFLALNRSDFYQYVPEGVAEVSITGAHHEDAQFALEPQADEFDSESSATEELQITFAGALAAAAFSLGTTGKLDYAWNSFADALKSGKLFGAARK
jgi:hypothetical protein